MSPEELKRVTLERDIAQAKIDMAKNERNARYWAAEARRNKKLDEEKVERLLAELEELDGS